MKIGDWSATRSLSGLYREIRELGLETNLAELEAFGFTIIEDALDADLTVRVRDAVLRVAEQRLERSLDLVAESDYDRYDVLPWLLFEDPVFEEAVLIPGPLSLVTYLLGESCLLSSVNSHLKGPGGRALPLHADNGNGVPSPFTAYEQVCNFNYALTDYTESAGCFAVVPGSHRRARQPVASEASLTGSERNPDAIPLEVPAGSAIVYRGHTWHGSFPRADAGLRVNLTVYFCRRFLEPQEDHRRHIPAELLERHGADSRMARLLGTDLAYSWTEKGPDPVKFGKSVRAGRSWHA